jgi:hypothetical protein
MLARSLLPTECLSAVQTRLPTAWLLNINGSEGSIAVGLSAWFYATSKWLAVPNVRLGQKQTFRHSFGPEVDIPPFFRVTNQHKRDLSDAVVFADSL